MHRQAAETHERAGGRHDDASLSPED
jgi:hypothetical protein